MTTSFSAKETKLLTACMKFMNSDVISCIDFDKVAVEAGYKDAKNAKTMFSRLKKAKLDGATGSSSGVGGDKVNKTISKKSTVSPRKASKGEIKVVKRGKMSKATTHSEVTSEGGGDGDDKDEDLSDIEDSEDKDVLAEDQSDSGQEVMQSQGANGFTTVNHAIASEDEEA